MTAFRRHGLDSLAADHIHAERFATAGIEGHGNAPASFYSRGLKVRGREGAMKKGCCDWCCPEILVRCWRTLSYPIKHKHQELLSYGETWKVGAGIHGTVHRLLLHTWASRASGTIKPRTSRYFPPLAPCNPSRSTCTGFHQHMHQIQGDAAAKRRKSNKCDGIKEHGAAHILTSQYSA